MVLIFIVGQKISLYLALEKGAAKLAQVLAEEAPAGVPQFDEVQITIHTDNSIDVDGVAATMASLKDELGKHLTNGRKIVVTLISGPDTKKEIAEDVLNVCEELKIDDITFTVSEAE